MVPVLPRRGWFVRQPYGASRCVDRRRESSLEVVPASGGAARPAEGSQVLRWAVLAVEPARPEEWFRGTEGRLDAWRDGSAAGQEPSPSGAPGRAALLPIWNCLALRLVT